MTLDTGSWSDPEFETLRALFAERDQVEISRQPIHVTKKVKDSDTPTVWESVSSDDSEALMEAMTAEIKSLQAHRTRKLLRDLLLEKSISSKELGVGRRKDFLMIVSASSR
jgi:hypothetical protein